MRLVEIGHQLVFVELSASVHNLLGALGHDGEEGGFCVTAMGLDHAHDRAGQVLVSVRFDRLHVDLLLLLIQRKKDFAFDLHYPIRELISRRKASLHASEILGRAPPQDSLAAPFRAIFAPVLRCPINSRPSIRFRTLIFHLLNDIPPQIGQLTH